MTAVDDIAGIRRRREAIVHRHPDAENRHDVEATIATLHRPRYEVNGVPSDGRKSVCCPRWARCRRRALERRRLISFGDMGGVE
jgi:hypothetical protein